MTYEGVVEWSESPRMRWRAIGFRPYLRQFGLSLLAFVSVFTALGVLIVLRFPGPKHPPATTILFMTALGLAMRLLFELIGANVALTRTRLIRRTGASNDRWHLADYASVRCTPANGVLRVELDGPIGQPGKPPPPIVVAAPLKKEDDIRRVLLASVRSRTPADQLATPTDTPDATKGTAERDKPLPSVQGPVVSVRQVTGMLLIGGSLYLSWLALQGFLRIHRLHWFLALIVILATLSAASGVLCLTHGSARRRNP